MLLDVFVRTENVEPLERTCDAQLKMGLGVGCIEPDRIKARVTRDKL